MFVFRLLLADNRWLITDGLTGHVRGRRAPEKPGELEMLKSCLYMHVQYMARDAINFSHIVRTLHPRHALRPRPLLFAYLSVLLCYSY